MRYQREKRKNKEGTREMTRLNKYMASCGVCSRRKADEWIAQGFVKVNGCVVTDLGTQVEENKDTIMVKGEKISLQEEKVYFMLNKPKGYVTTNDEQFGRPCTLDLMKEEVRVFPIGRLDMYTEGLLLFTNDGEFANQLMHPKNKIQKTYIVRVPNHVPDSCIQALEKGVDIGDYVTQPAKVERVSSRDIAITITEGKNRQIRRMCEAVGIRILNLKRVQIGNLNIGNLKKGEYRALTKAELKKIR